MSEPLTIAVSELEQARDPNDAVIRTRGKAIVLVDGARLMSLRAHERVVILIFREGGSVSFARIVARVGNEPLPE